MSYIKQYIEQFAMTLTDDFEIGDKLGEGAFGLVYNGTCRKTGKRVAIKVEREPDNPTSFVKHEAQVLIALKGCKGVPPLLGYGMLEGHRYLVVPLFDESLADRVKRDGLLSGMTALTLRKRVKDIVKDIHRRGFIHRDIKPDNVMFAGDSVYLIDFGCATNYRVAQKRHREKSSSPNNRTPPKTSSYVGTYEFLGEMGRQGYVCCEVDFEGVDKTIDACMECQRVQSG